eukprot:SAG31_NODE_1355_length_8661_cov_3.130343_3_plen_177_part_00
MVFDMASVAALSRSLRILELADNGLTAVGQLCYLGFLENLVLSDNAIAKSAEVGDMLSGMTYLQSLDLQNNPLTKEAKYRDRVILASGDMLGHLDGKEIGSRQRDFLKQMQSRRLQQRKAKAGGPAKGSDSSVAKSGSRPPHGGEMPRSGAGAAAAALKPATRVNELSLGNMVGNF